jgi:hypothetical protein
MRRRDAINLFMDGLEDPINTPPAWVADLLASKAEVDRGERGDMQPALDDMQAAIDRIRAKRAKFSHA